MTESVNDLLDFASRCPSINKEGIEQACKSLIRWSIYCELLEETKKRIPENSDVEGLVYEIMTEWYDANIDQWPIELNVLRERIKQGLTGRKAERSSLKIEAKKWHMNRINECEWKLSKCGNAEKLELDHKWPRSFGGTSDRENTQLLCRFHNQLKGNLPIWGEIEWK